MSRGIRSNTFSRNSASRSFARRPASQPSAQRFNQVRRQSRQQQSAVQSAPLSPRNNTRSQTPLRQHTLTKPVTNVVSHGNKLDLQRSQGLINEASSQRIPHAVNIKGNNNQLSLPQASSKTPFLSVINGNQNQLSTKAGSGNEVVLSGGNNNTVRFGQGRNANDVSLEPNRETGKVGTGNVFDATQNKGFNEVNLNGFGDHRNYDISSVDEKFTITNKVTGETNTFEGFQRFSFGDSEWRLHFGSDLGFGWENTKTGEFNAFPSSVGHRENEFLPSPQV